MDSIEKDIHQILVNSGITAGYEVYETRAKQDVDNIILINAYGGKKAELGIEYPSVQITVRNPDIIKARDKAYEIVQLFSMYASCEPYESLFEQYSIEIIAGVSAPIELGWDKTEERFLFAINLDVIRVNDIGMR